MNTPPGVRLIALMELWAVFLILFALVIFLLSVLISIKLPDDTMMRFLLGYSAAVLICLLLAANLIWIARSLLRMQNWARWASVVLGILFSLALALTLAAGRVPFTLIVAIYWGILSVNVTSTAYLLFPRVRAHFHI